MKIQERKEEKRIFLKFVNKISRIPENLLKIILKP